jgi:hypothetical protein
VADHQWLSDLASEDLMFAVSFQWLSRFVERVIVHQEILIIDRQLDHIADLNFGKTLLRGRLQRNETRRHLAGVELGLPAFNLFDRSSDVSLSLSSRHATLIHIGEGAKGTGQHGNDAQDCHYHQSFSCHDCLLVTDTW